MVRMMRLKIRSALFGPLMGIAGVGLSACVSGSSTDVVKECILPDDQSATLSGRWKLAPVPVAVRAANFTTDEMAILKEAADSWNTFFGESMSIQIFDYGSGAVQESGASKPTSVCSNGLISGSRFTGEVVIYRQNTWPYSNHSAIAITSFCPVAAKPIPSIFMAMMELNYEDFFIEGKKQPDLKSIFIHELGHLLGLDHSCENNSTRDGIPDCKALTSAQTDYYSAVMFPVVKFTRSGIGETRATLNNNDMGRANCLYGSDGAGAPAVASRIPASSSE